MLLIEGLRSLQRPTYLQTPIGGHHHQLRSLDLVGQLTSHSGPFLLIYAPGSGKNREKRKLTGTSKMSLYLK